MAQRFLGGVDVWLNNPRRPAEASGTSGMKTLVNGGLNVSTLDGWWDEAYSPAVGWAIGGGRECGPEDDARQAGELYDLLEHEIVPEFYDRDREGIPRNWVARIRASMAQLTPRFSSNRMVQEYVESAYLPAAQAYQRRAADGGQLAQELERWREHLDGHWHGLRFGETRVLEVEGQWQFELQVYLGDLSPDAVRVELYAEPTDREPNGAVPMKLEGPISGAVSGFLYSAAVPITRPANHYTPRIRPYHPEAFVPQEAAKIAWRH